MSVVTSGRREAWQAHMQRSLPSMPCGDGRRDGVWGPLGVHRQELQLQGFTARGQLADDVGVTPHEQWRVAVWQAVCGKGPGVWLAGWRSVC